MDSMQPIRYNVNRSSFYAAIDEAVRASDDVSRPVRVDLEKPRGLVRNLRMEILRDDPHTFRSDWKHDPGWFSARLRAAATVLRDRKQWGVYHATHRDGVLVLERA